VGFVLQAAFGRVPTGLLIIASIAASAPLVFLIEVPLERWRAAGLRGRLYHSLFALLVRLPKWAP